MLLKACNNAFKVECTLKADEICLIDFLVTSRFSFATIGGLNLHETMRKTFIKRYT